MSRPNRRVLVVDDHADFLESVRQLLAERFEVFTAASGAEALAVCEAHGPFAAVLSDYGMPGMSGIQLFAELRQLWPDTPRLLLTGCGDLALALEALEEGAIFRFLSKPPRPAQLLESVAQAVARSHELFEERLATAQLAFTCEALGELNRALETRLAREGERLTALEQGCTELAGASSLEDVLARGTAAVQALLGAGAARVELRSEELEIVPERARATGESRSLAILAGAARQACERSTQRARTRESKHALLEALQGLARHRDDETGAHLARVSEYCRFLARALVADGHFAGELGADFIDDLGHAAPLHDVGKVAIPDAILFKPGKLDEREWSVMRTHAALGAEILSGITSEGRADVLALAREIAWTHHERWDGTGYPRGLAGASIPLAGRIMALADCYDALTSERPYKHAWPHAAAVAHLREQRGLAFDPILVDSLLAREGELEAMLERSRAVEARLSP